MGKSKTKKEKNMNKEKIFAIVGVIILAIMALLAGSIDSEAKQYLESQPQHDLKHSLIRH